MKNDFYSVTYLFFCNRKEIKRLSPFSPFPRSHYSLSYSCSRKAHENEDEDSFDEGKVEDFYREIFSDLSVDGEERKELLNFFGELKPSATGLIWMRAAAFRIGSEFLTDDGDSNVSLLKSINSVVHAIETTCME